jgi:hypothetical protein
VYKNCQATYTHTNKLTITSVRAQSHQELIDSRTHCEQSSWVVELVAGIAEHKLHRINCSPLSHMWQQANSAVVWIVHVVKTHLAHVVSKMQATCWCCPSALAAAVSTNNAIMSDSLWLGFQFLLNYTLLTHSTAALVQIEQQLVSLDSRQWL